MSKYKGPTDRIVEVNLDNLADITEPPRTSVPTSTAAEAEDYNIKSATNSLKKELEWEAKEIAFGLITKPVSSFGIFLAITGKIDVQRVGKAGFSREQLGNDKRFIKLLREVEGDFNRGLKAAQVTH